jgi:hypothetical protein
VEACLEKKLLVTELLKNFPAVMYLVTGVGGTKVIALIYAGKFCRLSP